MSEATLEAALRNAFSSGMGGDELTLVWHAGEPLVMPVDFYRRARAVAAELAQERGVHVRHSFQANATLIDDAWCDFLEQPDVMVGVSVDGPASSEVRPSRRVRKSSANPRSSGVRARFVF
jgi:uncharacterized protein